MILEPDGLAGDINLDQSLNIFDIIIMIDFILGTYNGEESNDFLLFSCDLNNDSIVNIVDIIELVNQIMALPLTQEENNLNNN